MIRFPALDDEMLKKIHSATIEVLSNTGIVISHPQAISLLQEHGGMQNGERMTIPEELIEKCISLIPKTVTLQGRDPNKSIILPNGSFHAHNVGGVPNLFDPVSGIRRPATRKDNKKASRILDKLPNVASITPLFTPQDVPGPEMSLWMVYDTIANSTKPFRAPGMQTGAEIRALGELIRIACPNRHITVGVSPVSPLSFPDGIIEAILEISRQGFVLGPLPCPILGATAPMTISGGLVQQNAEVLAANVLAQISRPGTAIIYKGRLSVMNPYSGLSVWGNPEIGLISAATVAIAHSYGIPADVYGFCTNAHEVDIQNGFERTLNAIIPVAAGADEISGIGEMDGGVNSSFVQLIIDDEITKSIKRLQEGIVLDTERLATDIIDNVMDGPRNFLTEMHTIKYLRRGEVITPKLAVRDSWSQWETNHRRSIIDNSEDRVNSLLKEINDQPLSMHQKNEMKKVIKCSQLTP